MKVSVKQKKEFIGWFLNHYQLKRRECVWILTYLRDNADLLKQVRFVSELNSPERTMVMSTHCTSEIHFEFHKNGQITNDAEKAFHDIRTNRNELINIKLNFKDSQSSVQLYGVLEDAEGKIPEEFSIQAEEFLALAVYNFQVNKIKKEIDLAIENNDKERFMELTENLIKFEKPSTSNIKIIKNRLVCQ